MVELPSSGHSQVRLLACCYVSHSPRLARFAFGFSRGDLTRSTSSFTHRANDHAEPQCSYGMRRIACPHFAMPFKDEKRIRARPLSYKPNSLDVLNV